MANNIYELTVFTSSKSSVTKSIKTIDDKIIKTSGVLSEGSANRQQITSISHLAALMESLNHNNCLCYGVNESPFAKIGSKNYLKDGQIARSKETFTFGDKGGVLFIDCDKYGVSQEELMQKLYSAMPELKSAPTLITRSSSHGVYIDGVDEPPSEGGFHVYVLVDKASKIPDIGDILYGRLTLNGECYYELNSSVLYPAALERSLIDKSVWQGSRIDYAAPPICIAPADRVSEPFVILNDDAEPLKTDSVPPISYIDKQQIEAIMSSEKAKIKPEADEKQKEIIAKQPKEKREAFEYSVSCVQGDRLPYDFEVCLAVGGSVTIGEIMDNPSMYNGAECLDPVEPNYRDSAVVGMIYSDQEVPSIHSMAHGGRTYLFDLTIDSGIAVDLTEFINSFNEQPTAKIKNDDGDEMEFQEFSPELQKFNGVLGHLVKWIMNNSPKPNLMVAIPTAIQIVGTVIGRDFRTEMNNYSNLQIMIVGKSGCGKEEAMSASIAFRSAIKNAFEGEANTLKGEATSPSAIITALEETPRLHFISDEVDQDIKIASMDNASENKKEKVKLQMELFGRVKSEYTQKSYSQKTIKKKDRETDPDIIRPFASFTGMTTEEGIKSCLNRTLMRNGFINRQLFFFSRQGRMPLNRKVAAPLPREVLEWVEMININIGSVNNQPYSSVLRDKYDEIGKQVELVFTEDAEALRAEYEFETQKMQDELDEENGMGVVFERAVELSMRLALIFSLSANPNIRVINKESMSQGIAWANFLKNDEFNYWKLHFSENTVEKQRKEVYNVIHSRGSNGILKRDLLKMAPMSSMEKSKQNDCLSYLFEADKVHVHNETGGRGRPKERLYSLEFIDISSNEHSIANQNAKANDGK